MHNPYAPDQPVVQRVDVRGTPIPSELSFASENEERKFIEERRALIERGREEGIGHFVSPRCNVLTPTGVRIPSGQPISARDLGGDVRLTAQHLLQRYVNEGRVVATGATEPGDNEPPPHAA